MSRREDSVDANVIAAMVHEYFNEGSKLAATTLKIYLENDTNSREDAVKLCNSIIDDAEKTISTIHKGLEE